MKISELIKIRIELYSDMRTSGQHTSEMEQNAILVVLKELEYLLNSHEYENVSNSRTGEETPHT